MPAEDLVGAHNVKPTSAARDDHPFLLTTAPSSRGRRRLAVCVLAALIGALLLTASFARTSLKDDEVLLPAYTAAVFVDELFTSTRLPALLSLQRCRRLVRLRPNLDGVASLQDNIKRRAFRQRRRDGRR